MSKILEKLSEIFGWIQIVFSVLLLAGIVGVVLFLKVNEALGVIVGVVILVLGIYIACRAYKSKGTIHLLSRTMATPELDNKEEDQPNDKKEK